MRRAMGGVNRSIHPICAMCRQYRLGRQYELWGIWQSQTLSCALRSPIPYLCVLNADSRGKINFAECRQIGFFKFRCADKFR